MNPSILISVIAVCVSAVSAGAALGTFFISYFRSKPRIRIRIHQADGCLYFCNMISPNELDRFVIVTMDISNHSSVGGTIADIYYVHDGVECHAQTVANTSEPKIPFVVKKHNFDLLRRRLPLAVPAFSADIAMFYFPDPPPVTEHETEVTFYATVIGDGRRRAKAKKLKKRKIVGSIMTDISRDPNKVTFISAKP